MTDWKPFEPKDGERMVRVVDAYDAIAQFVRSQYGPLLETEEGLSRIYSDVFRGDPDSDGWLSDQSTWSAWVDACDHVVAVKSAQINRGKES